MITRAIAQVLLAALVLVQAGCHRARTVKVLKLGHGLDRNHSVHQAMEIMAANLRERSGGRMDIHIYPSEQLGNEREMVELLQLGSLAMTKVSAAVMESFAPEFKIFGIPYLFADREHQFRVLDGALGRELMSAGEPYLLRGLAYYDSGSRSFYTKDRPITHPDDLAGMKLRVMASATAIKMVRALGAAATPMPFGELYTALQQGVVDGAENNPPSFFLTRHYEICKYYSLDEHTSIPDIVVIGTQAWNALSAEEQGWLQAAADASVIAQRKLWTEAERSALAEAEKAGVQIVHPNKEAFAARVQAIHTEYESDPRLAPIIRAIKAERQAP